MSDARRTVIVENALDLLDKGESAEVVAHRLGYANAENLARSLERWGEPSLARRMRRPRLGLWAA